VRTSTSEELQYPLSEKCPHWTNLLPLDCGRLYGQPLAAILKSSIIDITLDKNLNSNFTFFFFFFQCPLMSVRVAGAAAQD